jgi:nitrate reductase NapAB chaperone NapD
MLVSGVVIETVPGRAVAVAARLATLPGLTVEAHDAGSRIAAVWRSASGEELAAAAERLVERDDDVLGVFPTFSAEERTTS